MKDHKIKPYGIEINYSIPTTAQEFDELAGREGATLDLAVKQELYHGSYGDIRAEVTEKLIAAGYERQALKSEDRESTDAETGEVTTETVVTKWETDAKFFERVCAELDVDASHFSTLVQEAADSCPFDPSRKERVAKAKKVAKTHLAAAQEIADAGALEAVAAKLGERLNITIDVSMGGDLAIENLGRAISLNEANEKKALKDKYANL